MSLEDELYLLRKSVDDLFSIHHVIEVTEGHPEWSAEKDTLSVVRRAVGDIAGTLSDIIAELEVKVLKDA